MAHHLWEGRLICTGLGRGCSRGKDLEVEELEPGSPISWGMTFLLFTGATTPLIRYRRRVRSSLRVARAGEQTYEVGEVRSRQAWGGAQLCV